MRWTFEGQRVFITGATGVVGRRIVRAFAREGARLFLSDASAERLDAFRRSDVFSGVEVSTAAADLRNVDEVLALCRAAEAVWDGLDVVVNNAGIYPMKLLSRMSPADWDELMAINLRAPFLVMKHAVALMRRQGVRGSIVNVTSGAGLRAKVGHAHYSTSKAALDMLTRSFALEAAPFGIRVNGLIPGFAPGSELSELPGAYSANMVASTPLGRTSGPADAPSAVLFLCSPLAAFITGTTLAVDGGRGAGALSDSDRAALAAN